MRLVPDLSLSLSRGLSTLLVKVEIDAMQRKKEVRRKESLTQISAADSPRIGVSPRAHS